MRPLAPIVLAVLAAAALAAPAGAQTPPPGPGDTPGPTYRPDTPQNRVLYRNGPTQRYLMGGKWLYRADPKDEGVGLGFFSSTSTAGWTQVNVPHDWTARQISIESMAGSVGWYRKDFRLPDTRAGLDWIVRFESVNYYADVYLNGRRIARHEGANLPFEVELRGLRRGVNRLVVRVDSRRDLGDLPPGGIGSEGVPRGGWWNSSGLLREVYLRKVDTIAVHPVRWVAEVPRLGGAARVTVEATVRNMGPRSQLVRLRGSYGSIPVDLGQHLLQAGQERVVTRRVTIPRPRLWSPQDPFLYRASLGADTRDLGTRRPRFRHVADHVTHTGIKKVEIRADGLLRLNGRVLNLRGFGLHEDNAFLGAAVHNRLRDNYIAWTESAGGTIIRGHYPFSPYLQEKADREGVLLYSEVPVWSVPPEELARRRVREAGLEQLRTNIVENGNHPSILTWSIGNELTARPGPPEELWINSSVDLAHELDPTRPVTLAIIGYPFDECRPIYGKLDFVSVNTYFGWYPGAGGQAADRELLGPFLDQVRNCYPRQPVMVTEFGAEGNRSGPVEERGTYEFQDDYLRYTLGVFATKPYLAGAVYWTLQEFRVRPGYTGGNPRGDPSWHQKGPFDRYGNRKPVFGLLQQSYSTTPQFR